MGTFANNKKEKYDVFVRRLKNNKTISLSLSCNNVNEALLFINDQEKSLEISQQLTSVNLKKPILLIIKKESE